MGIDDRVEVLCASDHHLAPDDRLDSVVCDPIARENPFAGEAQRHDLAAARRIRFELGDDTRADEHYFIATRALFAERPARFDLHDAVRHFVE